MNTYKDYRLLMGILEDFGQNVRREREKIGLSQEKIAEKAGLHRTYIGMIERGERNVTLKKASKIADSLEVNLSKLIPK
jgi:transcriptional regulator with XRE-family HTH domain